MGCATSKSAAIENTSSSENQEIYTMDRGFKEESRKRLKVLLGSQSRDYLVDSHGRKVKIDTLKGKTIGLYFSANAVPAAREFTRILLHMYKDLITQKKPFEVVFISNDESQEIWKESMKEMPWLALPFTDREAGDNLGMKFNVSEIPTFVIVDENGNKVTSDGVEIVQQVGGTCWPFATASLQREHEDSASHQNREDKSTEISFHLKDVNTNLKRHEHGTAARDNRISPENPDIELISEELGK